jgi:acetoin utilization deacetylase AcuC-like enzyme
MDKLVVFYDDTFLLHESPFSHPENPSRLKAVLTKLKSSELFKEVELLRPIRATEEDILLVHSRKHLEYVRSSIKENKLMLDPDTYAVNESWNAAMIAAGSVTNAVDLVFDQKKSSVFCLIRPPGHHAESTLPMGFCLFNNAAVGAKYALTKHKLEQIAIIDWDVHHGNGTQEIFYNTSEVFYISLHQFPLYPGTGTEQEVGSEKGENFTLNFPLPAYTKGEKYIKIFKEIIIPKLAEYKPQLIIISAGFDAHKDDPLANMLLVENDYAEMTNILKKFASSENIPIISILEGGYNLDALADSVYSHLKILKS